MDLDQDGDLDILYENGADPDLFSSILVVVSRSAMAGEPGKHELCGPRLESPNAVRVTGAWRGDNPESRMSPGGPRVVVAMNFWDATERVPPSALERTRIFGSDLLQCPASKTCVATEVLG